MSERPNIPPVPESERALPICPYFARCGACATQHWALPPTFAWKRNLVLEALRSRGVDAAVDETIDAHGDGRRRVVFHARQGAIGYMAAQTHDLVAIDLCPILSPALGGAIPAAQAIGALFRGGKPLDIQVTATASGLDVDVRGSGALNKAEHAALAQIAAKHRLARVTRHGELVAQNSAPVITVGRATVALPPASFLQATVAGEETLARLVIDHAGKAKNIADLFAGVGTFSLRLAERAKINAFDNDATALAALTQAAKNTSGLKPIVTHPRDLFRQPVMRSELKAFDAVVFDPPRQGAEAQAREMAASGVRAVIGVSCNATTFARDARILIDGGYTLERVTPVDQFRFSAHVELVALFER